VRIAPNELGGLLGAAELAWDAANGVPLRAAVYARGSADPVLELKATEIAFGPVPLGDVDVSPPPGAKLVDLAPKRETDGSAGTGKPVTGLAAVQARLPFKLAAPDTLAGRQRTDVWLAGHGDDPAAAVVYGKGLGAIAVVEHKAKAGEQPLGGAGGRRSLQLGTIDLGGGVLARELPTALGTIVTFQRDGVETVVAGSVAAHTVETAARELR
jgi:hypothetical protein